MPQTDVRTTRARRVFRFLAELAIVLAIVGAVSIWQTRSMTTGPVPPLSGDLLGGGRFDIGELRGRPAIVYFWATWCGICRAEAGTIASIAADHPVITVAMQSGGAAEVASHLASSADHYPVLLDDDGAIAARFGVRGVPAIFVLDEKGEIRFTTRGYTTEIGLRLRLWSAAGGL